MSKATGTMQCWSDMKQRCFNHKSQQYKNYGGRGITVCDRWLVYTNFLSDMGERPENMTIERINNDGNYEPSNCRWATRAEQRINQRTVRFVEINGKKLPISHAARMYGMDSYTFTKRINKGMTPEEALSKPIDKKRSSAARKGNEVRWSKQ